MEACEDPFGTHGSNPLKYHSKSKSKFRNITPELAEESPIPLTIGKLICNSCRSRIHEEKKKSFEADQQIEIKRKHVYCANPFNDDTTHPKRKLSHQKFALVSGELQSRANANGLVIPVGSRLCFDCHTKLLKAIGDLCTDPLGLHSRKPRERKFYNGFHTVTANDESFYLQLGMKVSAGEGLCGTCRLKLRSMASKGLVITTGAVESNPPLQAEMEVDVNEDAEMASLGEESSTSSDEEFQPESTPFQAVIKVMEALHIEVPTMAELRKGKSAEVAAKEISTKATDLLRKISGRLLPEGGRNCERCVTHVHWLAEKFHDIETKRERMRLLTCAPEWPTAEYLQSVFNISSRMAKKSIELKNSKGPFSAPPLKVGRKLPDEVVERVKRFYLAPENSRISPNSRDVIIVSRLFVDGKKTEVREAKQLIQLSSEQLYLEYKTLHPEDNISYTSFTKLKPKQCVWPYRKGFQRICVCEAHENLDLLLNGIKIYGGISHLLGKVLCGINNACLMGNCDSCPDWRYIDDTIENCTQEVIEYWRWVRGADKRTQIVKFEKDKQDYKDYVKSQIITTASHHLAYVRQKDYIRGLRKFRALVNTTAVCLVDFAQNYAFIFPSEVSSFHWTNTQATVVPFVFFYRCNAEEDVKLFSVIVISDCLTHDASSFHAFRYAVLQNIFKLKFSFITHIHYVSDGPTSEFKNVKNFSNLANHLHDFGMTAEWSFSASGHGKSTCDGLGAVAKRLTRIESLRRKEDFILTARDMYSYLQDYTVRHNDESKVYLYVSTEDVELILQKCKITERYNCYKPIAGTRNFHHVKALNDKTLRCKQFSNDDDYADKSFFVINSEPPEISRRLLLAGEYIMFKLNKSLAVGMVQFVEDDGSLEVIVMKKCEKGQGYKWSTPDIIRKLAPDASTAKLVAPTTQTGRIYSFDQEDLKKARVSIV